MRRARLTPLVVFLSGMSGITVPAAAQSAPVAPPPAAAAAPTQAPDIVVLNDGSRIRGTILELSAGNFVELQTVGGERRRYPMTDVKYAGPAAAEPAAPPPAGPSPPPPPPAAPDATPQPMVTVRAPGARLHLTAKRPGITYQRKSSSAVGGGVVASGYEVMCAAPCDVTVPEGTHTLALSLDGGAPHEAPAVSVTDGAQLEGNYESMAGTRTAGWVLSGVGVAVMLAGLPLSQKKEDGVTTFDSKIMMGTLLGGGAAMLVGVILAVTPDKAEITVVPVASSRREQALDPRLDRVLTSSVLPGLTLAGRF